MWEGWKWRTEVTEPYDVYTTNRRVWVMGWRAIMYDNCSVCPHHGYFSWPVVRVDFTYGVTCVTPESEYRTLVGCSAQLLTCTYWCPIMMFSSCGLFWMSYTCLSRWKFIRSTCVTIPFLPATCPVGHRWRMALTSPELFNLSSHHENNQKIIKCLRWLVPGCSAG